MSDREEKLVYGPTVEVPPNNRSLGEHFLQRFELYKERVAQLVDLDGEVSELSYAAILRNGKKCASVLRKFGIQPADTVMAVCGNTLDYAPILWGTLFVGATIAPANPLYDKSDLLHLLTTIRPQLVITAEHAESAIKEALAEYSGAPVVCIAQGDLMKRLKEEPEDKDFVLGVVQDPDTHVASVICTSGTSGKPKCAEITHTSILLQLGLNYLKSQEGENACQLVSVNIAGPFGVAGQLINFMCLNSGQKCVLVPIERFEEVAFLQILEKHKVNFVILGTSQLISLCKCSNDVTYDLSNIMSMTSGGSVINLAMYELAKTKLNVNIVSGYGMTEAMGLFSPAYNKDDKRGSVGTLAANVIAKVVDTETGQSLGPMQEGELCFKLPSLMRGYRNNPEATAAAIDKDGFLHTGDTGFYDQDRYFYVVDRLKELIKYRNVHVPACDIEDVLLRHPAVLEASVIGVYHPTDWEHATAIVVKRPETNVSEQDLVKLVESELPPLKWLRGGVHFVSSIPKSLNDKVNKRLLRAQYSAMPEDVPSVHNVSINIAK